MVKFDNNIENLKNDGVIILPSLVNTDTINNIKEEIRSFNDITFNDVLGSFIISENFWIEHLGVHSELIMKTILKEELLTLVDSFFGEPSVLGSIKYQKKIKTHKPLKLHSDKGPGLVAFLFLNDIDIESGATRFIKGTHILDHDNYQKKNLTQITDYFDPDDFKNFESVTVNGSAGTLLLFSQKILHDLPEISKIGREIIWFTFYPKSFSYLSENHLISKNIIMRLNKNQRDRVLFDDISLGTTFMKYGNNISLIDTHKVSKFRITYYVLYYKILCLFRVFFDK